MILRFPALLLSSLAFCAAWSSVSLAAKLPPIMSSTKNTVPSCVTPGRLMAYLKHRNHKLDTRFKHIATEYMRHGEELGVRWDYAFFQMLVETRSLKFTGDVHRSQNNFAGLGATGRGVRGEEFKSVSDGARAHLQHTLMYAGRHIDDPVAERTRKIQAWRVLDKWRNKQQKPITFKQLTRKWSPGDRGYARDIQATANGFFERFCTIKDPYPEYVAKARGQNKVAKAKFVGKNANSTNQNKKPKRPSIEGRSSLGGPSLAEGLSKSFEAAQQRNKNDIVVLNGANKGKINSENSASRTPKIPAAKPPVENAVANTGGASNALRPALAENCRVWTASYGGNKAVLIKARDDNGMTNFTVLDVNAGQEDREANAYIAAYAKGGEKIARYNAKEAALDKAFQLCPEK